jgi:hypothetical protein
MNTETIRSGSSHQRCVAVYLIPGGSPSWNITHGTFPIDGVVFEGAMDAIPFAFIDMPFPLGAFALQVLGFRSAKNQ